VFFSVTKLFQNKDTNLRRMVYLCIKDICPSADEVIIVTSSLMKDMNSKTDLYRANAVRVLCKIIDSGLLMQVCICGREGGSHSRALCVLLSAGWDGALRSTQGMRPLGHSDSMSSKHSMRCCSTAASGKGRTRD